MHTVLPEQRTFQHGRDVANVQAEKERSHARDEGDAHDLSASLQVRYLALVCVFDQLSLLSIKLRV